MNGTHTLPLFRVGVVEPKPCGKIRCNDDIALITLWNISITTSVPVLIPALFTLLLLLLPLYYMTI